MLSEKQPDKLLQTIESMYSILVPIVIRNPAVKGFNNILIARALNRTANMLTHEKLIKHITLLLTITRMH